MTLAIRWNYARTLLANTSATLDDLRESMTTLEEIEPTARRVLGGANPLVGVIELSLAKAILRIHEETQSGGSA
jgi:hypothetical protein